MGGTAHSCGRRAHPGRGDRPKSRADVTDRPQPASSCPNQRTPEDNMTGTTRIPAAEINGFKGALIKRIARKTLGQVPSSLGVYWHNQKVLMSMANAGAKVKKWDACDEQLKSFAHMAVAAQVGCSWCLDFNYFEANNLHLDMDKAREVPRWRESEAFTPLEREVLAYAEAMTVTEPTVTDEMVASLRRQLGEAALV